MAKWRKGRRESMAAMTPAQADLINRACSKDGLGLDVPGAIGLLAALDRLFESKGWPRAEWLAEREASR